MELSAGGTVTAAGMYLADNAKLNFGTGDYLAIYHDGIHSYIDDQGIGNLILESNGGEIKLQTSNGGETLARFINQGAVELFHDDSLKLTTTADGVDISGTGSLKVPVGTTAQRNGSPTAGDLRYNSDDGAFEGYTSSWGALGGFSKTETWLFAG